MRWWCWGRLSCSYRASTFRSCGSYVSVGGEANGINYYFDGKVDEVQISQSVRSADWLTSEFNNQKPSSTFVSVGSEI